VDREETVGRKDGCVDPNSLEMAAERTSRPAREKRLNVRARARGFSGRGQARPERFLCKSEEWRMVAECPPNGYFRHA
jgi:hypothetical protein